jgi:hypothetical protein
MESMTRNALRGRKERLLPLVVEATDHILPVAEASEKAVEKAGDDLNRAQTC